jgi:hypothetical protein
MIIKRLLGATEQNMALALEKAYNILARTVDFIIEARKW